MASMDKFNAKEFVKSLFHAVQLRGFTKSNLLEEKEKEKKPKAQGSRQENV